MKNYLSKHYKNYYIQTADGQHLETTRKECLAQGESPTAENPFKQRWFYDGENFSYIVRLPRNEQGEALYRFNAQSVQNEERYLARKNTCVLKGTGSCDDDCGNCQRKRFPRIVELDKPLANDGENDGEPQYFDITADIDEYAQVEADEENEALLSAVALLSEQQQSLINTVFFDGKTLTQIAKEQGVSRNAIVDRLNKIYKKIKNLL